MNLMDLISHLASNAQQGAGDMGAVLEQLKSLAGISPAQGALEDTSPQEGQGSGILEEILSKIVPMGEMAQNEQSFGDLNPREQLNMTGNNLMSTGALGAGASTLGAGGRKAPVHNVVGGGTTSSPSFSAEDMGVTPQNMSNTVGFRPGTTLPEATQQTVHANAVRDLLKSVMMTGKLPANTPLSLEEISKILNSTSF